MKFLLALLVTMSTWCAAANPGTANVRAKDNPMTIQAQSLYPVIVTDKLAECRDFYVKHLGFQVVFEASWFIYLSAPGNDALGLAFMTPDHPSQPPGPEAFNGKGMFVTLQVDDAAAEHRRLRTAGVAMAYELKDEPWGQRRFGVLDPSGTWVDVVQQIEPAAGFWDKYMPERSSSERTQ